MRLIHLALANMLIFPVWAVNPLHGPLDTTFEATMWANQAIPYEITQTLHVDQTKGNDSNTGTANTPLKSITAALQKRKPGTRIIIHSGTYREKIQIPRFQGSPTQPLIIEAAKTGTVRISGSDQWKNWKRIGNSNIYHRAWFAQNLAIDNVDGAKPLGNRQEMVSVNKELMEQVADSIGLKTKSFWVDTASHIVYLQTLDGVDPNNALVEVPTRYSTLESGLWNIPQFANYVILRGLLFDHGLQNNNFGANHLLIEDCEFRHNGGIALETMGQGLLVRRTRFIQNGNGGIRIGPLFNDSVERNAVFEQCQFKGNKWRLGYYGGIGSGSVIKVMAYRNLVIRSNQFFENHAMDIWLDNRVINVTIEDNEILDQASPNVYYEIGGGDFVLRNSLVANGRIGVSISNSPNVLLEGNILYNFGKIIGSNWDPGYTRTANGGEEYRTLHPTFLNNVMVATSNSQKIIALPAWEAIYTGPDRIRAEANLYFAPTNNVFGDGKAWLDLKSWQSSIQGDAHSQFANPRFVNADSGIFDVLPESPLLNDTSWAFVKLSNSTNGIKMNCNRPEMEIRYTVNDFLPTKNSIL